MKLTRDDFPRLAGSLFIFCCALLFAVLAPVSGRRFLERAVLEESWSEKAFSAANVRVRQARLERESLIANQEAYRALVKRGIVGEFKRLDLLEHLEEIGSSFFDMQYSISPQQKIPASGFTLNANRAVFSLSLLHEGRLLDFFDALEAGTNGIPVPEGCDIERIAEIESLVYAPHLKATCALSWVTLEPAK